MSIVQNAIDWAIAVANDDSHGYEQGTGSNGLGRFGPNYDCSSFVISAYHDAFGKAGKKSPKDFGAITTRNMRDTFKQAGFIEVNDGTLKAGDVCLNIEHHTVMYIGSGRIVSATINEFGGVNNGKSGDQTGTEIYVSNYYVPSYGWDVILRYPEDESTETDSVFPALDKLPELRYGSVGRAVQAMQELLLLRGIQLPRYGADGEWGDETQAAVLCFQEICGMEANGICGADTWKNLTV